MINRIISEEIMAFMVSVIETAADRLFAGDRGKAFRGIVKGGIWELFINEYEKKSGLDPGAMMTEIRETLAAKSIACGEAAAQMEDRVALTVDVIRLIAVRRNWSFAVSFDRFYNARICEKLAEEKGLSAEQIFFLFSHEIDRPGYR